MDRDALDSPDDAFTDWAVSRDEALGRGQPADSTAETLVSAAELRRQERFETCLRRLEHDRQTRRRSVAPADSLPTELGPFQLRHKLGEGGFGVVYLAVDARLGRQVALKVPRPEVLLSAELRQRFVREAWTTARLNHAHIVPLFESGEAGPFCYLVSAYCAGGSLAGWLARQAQPVPARSAAVLVRALAGAVQHAHERGVLHRDLKPANILLDPYDGGGPWAAFGFVPRIADFGLAKFLADAPDATPLPRAPGHDPSLTQAQVFLGTPAYMAPEQAEPARGPAGPATDVYALGVILYELLTGEPPIRVTGHLETLRRVVENEPVSPQRRRPDVPPDLAAICLKCLEKKPERRYAAAGDLADDLERFLAGQPTRARPLGAAARGWKWCRRHPTVAALLAVAAVSLGLFAGGVAWHVARLHEYTQALEASAQREHDRAVEAEFHQRVAQERELRVRRETFARQLAIVGDEWKEGRMENLRTWLAPLRPEADEEDLRGFTWRLLWEQGRKLRALPPDPDGGVDALAFAPDGRLRSTHEGNSVRQWDVAGHRLEQERELPRPPRTVVRWPSFSADGRRLLSMLAADHERGRFRELLLWDTAARTVLARHALPPQSLGAVLSPDGRTAAYHTTSGTPPVSEVRVWDAATGAVRTLRQPAPGQTPVLRFAPDGQTLAVAVQTQPAAGGKEHGIVLWDLAAARQLHRLTGHQDLVQALCFSPDGRVLASGGDDGLLCLWDVPRGQPLYPPRECPGRIRALALAPDGTRLAVGELPPSGKKGTPAVSLWDVSTGQPLPVRQELSSSMFALAFAPSGKTVAVGCHDGSVRLWDWEEVPPFTTLPGPPKGEAWSVAFSPDSRTLAVGYDDEHGQDRHTLALWDVATGRPTLLPGHAGTVYDVKFAPDGRTLASTSWDRSVKLWDVRTGRVRHTLEGHRERVRSVAVSPDGATVISCGQDHAIRVWDAAAGRLRSEIVCDQAAYAVAFAPDGKTFAAAVDQTIGVWELAGGRRRLTLPDTTHVEALAFTPDGRTLASGNQSGAIKLWDLETGATRELLRGHLPGSRGGVLGLAFSPDGKTLASAGEDRTLRFWQPATGAELLCLKELPAQVNCVAFAPDGTRLAAALHDGSVRLWLAPPAPK